MSPKTLSQLQSDAVHLMVLLSTLRAALPDDRADSDVDTRFAVGWAFRMASELSNNIDLLDIHQQEAATPKGGRSER